MSINEKNIRLRDLRRAIEDYQAQKRELESCDYRAWDAAIVSFKSFIKRTPVVGDQLKALTLQAPGDFKGNLFAFDSKGSRGAIAPVEDETLRLASIARMMFEVDGLGIAKLGVMVTFSTGLQETFDFIREPLISVLLDRVEMELIRKLEDLADEHSDSDLIPISQTFIFASSAIVHTGTGNINVDMRSISQLGTDVLLRRIDELEKLLKAVADEQSRAAVAGEANDLALHKQLDKIKALIGAGQVEKVTGLWSQFVKEANMHNLTEAAGKVIEGVTLFIWVWNLSQGRPPSAGL